jgi:Arc/MetJ-type ribon-helix-helix transcriptional regulator
MKNIMFRVRIEPELKQRLETAVKDGKAKTMSDAVRCALIEFLEPIPDQN